MLFFIIVYLVMYVFFFYKIIFKFEDKCGDQYGTYRKINRFLFYDYNIYIYCYLLFNTCWYIFFFFLLYVKIFNYVFFIMLFNYLNIMYCLYIMFFFESLLAYVYHSSSINIHMNVNLISWNGFFFLFKLIIILSLQEAFIIFFIYTFFLIGFFGILKPIQNRIYNLKMK